MVPTKYLAPRSSEISKSRGPNHNCQSDIRNSIYYCAVPQPLVLTLVDSSPLLQILCPGEQAKQYAIIVTWAAYSLDGVIGVLWIGRSLSIMTTTSSWSIRQLLWTNSGGTLIRTAATVPVSTNSTPRGMSIRIGLEQTRLRHDLETGLANEFDSDGSLRERFAAVKGALSVDCQPGTEETICD